MPRVDVDGLTINYDVQGDGEPLLLIPYLSADHACYAFQLPAYAEHFSCIVLDLPGIGGERQALRAVLDRNLCRPGRRLSRRDRG
jgi:pimeloyl-ACP methyl ester carboxylesterase